MSALGSKVRIVCCAVVLTAAGLGFAPAPAEAASASHCTFNATLSTPAGMGATGMWPGPAFMSSIALVCEGSLLGTGVLTMPNGSHTPGPNVLVVGAMTMSVSSTTCTGTLVMQMVVLPMVPVSLNTNCGAFSGPGLLVPTGLGPPGTFTSWHLVADVVSVQAAGCSWVNGTGCGYTADTTSAHGMVVSPTAPTMTGATGTWSPTPIPGTGTSLWQATLSHSIGNSVSVSAATGTSGVIRGL